MGPVGATLAQLQLIRKFRKNAAAVRLAGEHDRIVATIMLTPPIEMGMPLKTWWGRRWQLDDLINPKPTEQDV